MPQTVLVVDVDDTLYPEKEFVYSALRATGLRAKSIFGIDGVGEVAIELFDSGNRGNIFQLALAHCGINQPPQNQISDLIWSYRNHHPGRLQWFSDAADFVRTYIEKGGRVAAITDGYMPTQLYKTEALKLSELASPIVFSEELGRDCWKPSPRPYEVVMDRLGRDSHFVYVGDNPVKDFFSAKALGWTTVRVRRLGGEHYMRSPPDTAHAPDLEVSDFTELAPKWEMLVKDKLSI